MDKIPLGFYDVDYDIIEKVIGRETYVRNKIKSRIAFWEGKRNDVFESYKRDTVEFYKKIDCVDLICFKEAPIVPPKNYKEEAPEKIEDNLWKDKNGRIYKASYESNEIVCVYDPKKKDIDDFTPEVFDMNEDELKPPDPSIFEVCDYLIENLTDRFIAGTSGSITAFTLLGGLETGLMMYALKPELIKLANEKSVKIQNFMDNYYIRKGQDGVLLEQDIWQEQKVHLSHLKLLEIYVFHF